MSKINLSSLSLYNEGMIKTYIHFSFLLQQLSKFSIFHMLVSFEVLIKIIFSQLAKPDTIFL